jgi:hypothetical protein
MLAGDAASKGVPRDPEGAFTPGTPEASTCMPQVAAEAEEQEGRLVQRGEEGELEKRPAGRGR